MPPVKRQLLRNERGTPICGARKVTDGTPCQSTTTQQNGRCKRHGGSSKVGISHANTKHGFYSKYLPKGLVNRFEASIDDPDKYNLVNQIALTDVRMTELLSQLKEAYQKQEDEPEEILDAKEISKVWEEINSFSDHRRKLVESERKRMVEAHQVITGERMMFIMEHIIKIIGETVTDKKQLAIISRKLGSILHQPDAVEIS